MKSPKVRKLFNVFALSIAIILLAFFLATRLGVPFWLAEIFLGISVVVLCRWLISKNVESWESILGLYQIYMRGILKHQPQPRLPTFWNRPANEVIELIYELGEENKRLQAEIDEARKLRVDFVANVSHELRTPLTSIQGYTETLLSGASTDPAKSQQFLERISENALRLKELISDILTLSQIETFPKQLDWETFQAKKLKEKLEKTFDPLVRAQNQKLSIEFDDTLVEGDFAKLLQVFVNLIENAVKYAGQGATIKVAFEKTNHNYKYAVSDNGPGIGHAHLPRIFERFYRVDEARNRETGGTGLGLSIAKHIVVSHGGNIDVTSQLGEGTQFNFNIPKRQVL